MQQTFQITFDLDDPFTEEELKEQLDFGGAVEVISVELVKNDDSFAGAFWSPPC